MGHASSNTDGKHAGWCGRGISGPADIPRQQQDLEGLPSNLVFFICPLFSCSHCSSTDVFMEGLISILAVSSRCQLARFSMTDDRG
jgi:hypothetical protein